VIAPERIFVHRQREGSTVASHDDGIYVGQYSPDGHLIATGSRDDSAWIVDTVTGQGLFRLWHKFWVQSADFSRNGDILATTSDKVYLWDTGSGTQLAVFDAPSKYQSGVNFSPDSSMLLAWGDRSATVFDSTLLTSYRGTRLRDFICQSLLARTGKFTDEEMRDSMLAGNEDARAPCLRSGPLSARYYAIP
jgi:WD40 repeat protein